MTPARHNPHRNRYIRLSAFAAQRLALTLTMARNSLPNSKYDIYRTEEDVIVQALRTLRESINNAYQRNNPFTADLVGELHAKT